MEKMEKELGDYKKLFENTLRPRPNERPRMCLINKI